MNMPRNTIHFYPRSPCGERPIKGKPASPVIGISIHALLAESDKDNSLFYNLYRDFYPRSPCGERPLVQIIISGYARISIHALLAESDGRHRGNDRSPVHFYPRSPCGERRSNQPVTMHTWQFLSTLSLRRATLYINRTAETIIFLSTLSLRRATLNGFAILWNTCISIHALLAESDGTSSR